MKKKYLWVLLVAVLVAAAAWGPIVSDVEQAKYTVSQSHGAIEIRTYEPMIVAEVEVSGEREEAISQGFRMIADYIFGNNIASGKVAMTAPVTQQPSEKIAMTAPVTQQLSGKGEWRVRFVMPSEYTIEKLPKPNNEAVKLIEIPAKRYAAIRFSGVPSQQRLKQEQGTLDTFIAEQGLKAVAAHTYAFFNPPWTLPFFRRNEVMVEIEQ